MKTVYFDIDGDGVVPSSVEDREAVNANSAWAKSWHVFSYGQASAVAADLVQSGYSVHFYSKEEREFERAFDAGGDQEEAACMARAVGNGNGHAATVAMDTRKQRMVVTNTQEDVVRAHAVEFVIDRAAYQLSYDALEDSQKRLLDVLDVDEWGASKHLPLVVAGYLVEFGPLPGQLIARPVNVLERGK